jgi:hypothetical protein
VSAGDEKNLGDAERAILNELEAEDEREAISSVEREQEQRAKMNGAAEPTDTRPESLTLAQMLERFVHVARGPLIVDISNTYRRLRPGEFSAAYAHNRVMIDRVAVPVTALWSQSDARMTADCMTFNPGEPQFFTEHGLRHLNIWSPPNWPVMDIKAATPFIEHLEYLIPDAKARDDLLDWLGHAAQVPQVRPHFHFLLVAAQEGTGRSWLAEVLRHLWGERHAGAVDLHRLLDDPFNSILSGKILMAVHEVKAPADERYSHRDRLKSLLTDSIITVNEKHIPRWSEQLCARFLMFTNRDDALPLSESDRRVYVVRCADEPRGPAYYKHLYARLNDEDFLAAVWQLLRGRDLTAFNPGQRTPLNEIKLQMIASGRTDEQQTGVEFIKACPHDVIAANDLMRVLAPERDEEQERDRRARMIAITAALRELGAQSSTLKVKMDGRTTRVWIVRNAVRWSAATAAALKEEAQKARKDIISNAYLADSVIELWQELPPR